MTSRHSVRLPDWGPYTKKYIGISHIPDERAGLRFDLSVFPGFYRRKVDVPNVMWESGHHPWEAAPDFTYYSYRHELEWKDRVYVDISYSAIDDHARLVRAHCVNNTDAHQSLVLHYMASMHFPPPGPYSDETLRPLRPILPAGALPWVRAVDYADLQYANPRHTDNLMPDGLYRGEVLGHGFTGNSGVGHNFGRDPGDRISFRIHAPAPIANACLILRYRMDEAGLTRFLVNGQPIELAGDDRSFQTASLPLSQIPAGQFELTLLSQGGAPVTLDGWTIVPANQIDQIRFEPVIYQPRPARLDSPPQTLLLKYPEAEPFYGLAWAGACYEIREIHDSNLDRVLRHYVHDHVRSYFPGDEKSHYTNVFLRPISLSPHTSVTLDAIVCQGSQAQVISTLAQSATILANADKIVASHRPRAADPVSTPPGEKYRFSQRLMAATTLTGIVYPVYTQRSYIKHYTPGRYWDCLYTWDSGFIGLGLLELDADRAFDCLSAYLTDPGNPHAAFIHHGSTVPVQFYLFLELWNRTQSRPILEFAYPRLRQYYQFLAGDLGSSNFNNLGSNLLRPWDYFYNSGGWDDYPPQKFVHANADRLRPIVTPVITTAQVIRCAKILRMAATVLGRDADIPAYDTDIARFSDALQTHSWDDDAGYFSYVVHDPVTKKPAGILRHESGANFNMGLDGVSPLVAGICTADQQRRLMDHLVTEGKLWTPIGLSAVDQSAPYYRRDGYWNGAVWFPHQWFIFKTMLDLGQTDFAVKIASTALELWKQETENSYHCFEHFMIETSRGAGWHQFSGLSTPVLSFHSALHRPGRFTAGLEIWVAESQFSEMNDSFRATVHVHGRMPSTALLCLDPGRDYQATIDGSSIAVRPIHPGLLEIPLPAGPRQITLSVTPSDRA